MEQVSLGLRVELALRVGIIFVQGLPFLICTATPLRLYTCIFLADGRRDTSCERNCVPISRLSDSEGAFALCTDIMRSLGVRFNPAGPNQHVFKMERGIQTIKSNVGGIPNTLPYNYQ